MYQRFLILVLLGLMSACGKETPRSPWPAHILSMDGMSEEEKAEVRKVVEDLNQRTETTAVLLDSVPSGFTISMKKNAPEEDVNGRAGFASVDHEKCNIDLSSLLFQSEMQQFIRPVILHELGHCAGLDHSDTEGEIMFKTTLPDSSYSEETIQRFIEQFRSAAGI